MNLHSQELEEWTWSKRKITFVALDNMKIILNESEEFEAENENISLYYTAMDFGDKTYEDLAMLVEEMSVEFGLGNHPELIPVTGENIEGNFVKGALKNENFIIFALGNKLQNAVILGMIKYETDWENTVVEMIRSIYMD